MNFPLVIWPENMPMGDAGRFQSTARSMLYFIACVKNATLVTFIAHLGPGPPRRWTQRSLKTATRAFSQKIANGQSRSGAGPIPARLT